MKKLTLIVAIMAACAMVMAERVTTNTLSLTGTKFLRAKTEATIYPNLFNVSGQYDVVTLVIEGSYVFSNGTTLIKAPVVSSKSYSLLALLNYDTNVWTNVMEKLFYTPVP